MNPSKTKGDSFEISLVHLAEEIGLKAYRNRMSRATPGESWDISIAGKRAECKKRGGGFKQIRKWLQGNDCVIVGSDREKPLVVMPYEEWIKFL